MIARGEIADTPAVLAASTPEDVAKALLKWHFERRLRDLHSNWPDGMPRAGQGVDDGLDEELTAFLAVMEREHPKARGVLGAWLCDYGGEDHLIHKASRQAGVTGKRGARLVNLVLTELIERIARAA